MSKKITAHEHQKLLFFEITSFNSKDKINFIKDLTVSTQKKYSLFI